MKTTLSSLKKRLGDILVDVGIITPAQLKEALEIQKRNGGKLGTILSQMGALNEEVMLAFLGKQCGVSYVSLSEYGEVPEDVVRTLPESVVRHQKLIPISKEQNVVTVAMADPFNVFAIDDIKVMTGYDVQVVIASEVEIEAAIDKYYSHLPSNAGQNMSEKATKELLVSILHRALESKATDVYIEPSAKTVRIRNRVDGMLYEKDAITHEASSKLIGQLKLSAGLNPGEGRLPREGRIKATVDSREVTIHVSFVPTVYGENAVLKFADPMVSFNDISKLGFDHETLAVYKNKIETKSGLILITGPIGSGKTATLFSTLSSLNYPDKNIVTVEDRIEHIVPGITQILIQPETGFTFSSGLRAAVAQKPDIIMLGELPDRETAQLALSTALAGHTVFSTLAANDTIDAVIHLINMGLERFLIASTVTMIAAQRLIRVICPDCKEQYEISRSNLSGLGISPVSVKDTDKVKLWRGKGCPSCGRTGYNGRTAIFEILTLNERLCSLILENAPESVMRETAMEQGLLTLRESAWKKVSSGVSSMEEMLRITKQSKG